MTITGKWCPVFGYTWEKIDWPLMHTKKECRNNLENFKSLLHHSHNGLKKTKTYNLWICQSIGKLKGVGHQEKSKMKDLSIQK